MAINRCCPVRIEFVNGALERMRTIGHFRIPLTGSSCAERYNASALSAQGKTTGHSVDEVLGIPKVSEKSAAPVRNFLSFSTAKTRLLADIIQLSSDTLPKRAQDGQEFGGLRL